MYFIKKDICVALRKLDYINRTIYLRFVLRYTSDRHVTIMTVLVQ